MSLFRYPSEFGGDTNSVNLDRGSVEIVWIHHALSTMIVPLKAMLMESK